MIFDHIVIGLGSMGSAALYHLSKRGKSVLGIEQFRSPHEHGSHGGQSRIIRMAYYEHPNYIPLLQRAYHNWDELERESGQKIFHRTGLFYAGPQGNDIIENVKKSASIYNIKLESYSHHNISISDQWEHFLEPNAGFLKPEWAIKSQLELAEANGAKILQDTRVLKWEIESNVVKVVTNKGEYYCKKIIFTAGPWTASLIKGIENHLTITKQLLAWVNVPKESFDSKHFPCWFIMDEDKPGAYYGFPLVEKDAFNQIEGMKLAYHYPGAITDPDAIDRNIDKNELDDIMGVVSRYFQLEPKIISSKICLYSNTPDEHFVIDNMPGMEDKVCFAWGFSGHGFKFVSVVGEILADLAIQGTTSMPIGFLNANRFMN